MDEFREEILMFQNKINDKLKKEEYKISKINNTLHFRFSKIPKNIYKNLDNYKNNIVKYQEFLNSDCEGEDLNILKTINFKRFTPNLICIEINSDEKNYESKIYSFLKEYNYKILCVKNYSHIFEKQNIKN